MYTRLIHRRVCGFFVKSNVRFFYHTARPTSKMYLQIIGTISPDTAPSVLLFADSERYLFNCGENLAQLIYYSDLKFDASKVFLTGQDWKHTGGLSGLYFLPQSAEPHGLNVYGPKGITDLMESTYMFSRKQSVLESLITCTEYDTEGKSYKDSNVNIQPVVFSTPKSRTTLFTSTKLSQSVSYICELADQRGCFVSEKAEELKIPFGPMRNQLHCGKSITLSDGRKVHPHEVISAPQPGQMFAIVECTNTETMDLLTSCNTFSKHFDGNSTKPLAIIVHMTPEIIFKSSKYQSWIAKFGPHTCHLIVNTSVPVCYGKSNIRKRFDMKLHQADPDLFPIARHKHVTIETKFTDLPSNCIEGESGMKYYFQPLKKRGLKRESIYESEWNSRNCFENPKKKQINTFKYGNENQLRIEDCSRVTFLGTASSKQSKMRATSSILVDVSSKCSIMFDCGDGTNFQLQRHYGSDFDHVLSSLSFVFISHLHTDHHMGLINILLHHRRLMEQGKFRRPLVIIGPEQLCDWLNHYNKSRKVINYRFYSFTDIKSGRLTRELKKLLTESDLQKLSIVPVTHCKDSHGIVITHSSGWKLVYSGDCAPSESLCREGFDATLLIHEATFLPEYKSAEKIGHSTTDGAIQIAKKMQARYTILTHFSQRYNLSALLNTPLATGVSLAFDHMSQ